MKQLLLILTACIAMQSAVAQNTTDTTSSKNPKVQVSLLYPIGSGGSQSVNEVYDVSVNILGGATGGVTGMEFSGIAGFTKGSVTGAQIAGYVNVVTDSFRGFQGSGMANVVKGNFKGVQVSGFGNAAISTFDGVQVSGFGNYAGARVKGVQLSGFANVALDTMEGVQGSGFVNYAEGTKGAQVSGYVNVNVGDMKGNQISGFVNVSTGKTEGVQLSGFVNVAKNIKGAQLGLINVADTMDGISVGFFSYARNGYHQFELSTNETFQTNLSFKTGVNAFYNVFSVAAYWNKNDPVWALGYGIGTRKQFNDKNSVNVELNSYSVLPDNFNDNNWESLNKLKLSYARKFGSHFEVFGGASFNMWVSESDEPMNNYLPSKKYNGTNGSVNWIMYPGFHAGIRL